MFNVLKINMMRRIIDRINSFVGHPLAYARAVGLKALKTTREFFGGRPDFPPIAILNKRATHVFLGYYDLSPFSADERYLLALHAAVKNRPPQPGDSIKTGYYSLNAPDQPFTEIGQSTTWCWQQGCRLRWHPGNGNELVSYNRSVNGRPGCVIQSIGARKTELELPRPVYDVGPDGTWGLGLNFSRLHRLRPGYGYAWPPDDTEGRPAPDDDGIWRIDFNSGEANMLFSVADAANYNPVESMEGAEHYFNHISISPSGKRFMFFHLWKKNRKRYNRVFTSDSNGNSRRVFDDGPVSHYSWKNDSTLLLIVCREGVVKFVEFHEITGDKRVIGSDLLTSDGHPSYSPDGERLLVDTYPDRCGDQHLYLYNERGNNRVEIGRFHNPFSFWKDLRCDLHPRWSPSGKLISIDLPRTNGYRAMGIIRLEN